MKRSVSLGIALGTLILLCTIVGGGVGLSDESDGALFTYIAPDNSNYKCEIISEEERTIKITECVTSQHNITVPSTITNDEKEYTVVEIGEGAFGKRATVITVDLPDTLKKIGTRAFEDSGILKSISIPDSVTDIGTNAFNRCVNLEQVKLPSNLEVINNNTFRGCIMLQHIVIPDSVTVIHNDAFADCFTLETVILSKSLVSMENAFSGCEQIRYINLPENLKDFDLGMYFSSSKIERIDVSEYNPYFKSVDNMVLTKDGKTLVYCPSGTEKAIVPDSVTEIGIVSDSITYPNVFNGKYLKEVVLPAGVVCIGNDAFNACSNLVKINLPDKIHTIGARAFMNCESLVLEKLPKNLKTIGASAFSNCRSINYLTVPYGVETVGDNAFTDCESLKNLELPDSIVSIGKNMFNGCSNLEGARLPDSTTVVGEFMFRDCTSLRTIVIPEHVHYIGTKAFENCKSLISIEFPATLAGGYNDAFEGTKFFDKDGTELSFGGESYKNLAGRTFAGYDCKYYEVENSNNDGYLIKFKNYDGSTFFSSYLKEGEVIVPPKSTPTRETNRTAFEFSHWGGYSEGMTATQDVSFSPFFKDKKVTAEFIWHDGSVIKSFENSSKIDSGYPASPPDYSEKNRLYTFDKWTSSTTSGKTADFTYVAAYKEVPGYYIDFDLDGGSGSMERIFVGQNTPATLPSFDGTRSGYTFGGWTDGTTDYTNGGTVPASDRTDCAPLTLRAVWIGEKYTLTINYIGPIEDGKFVAPAKVVCEYEPGNLFNIHSESITYYTVSDEYVTGTMPNHDLTIDVFYESCLYEIKFNAGTNSSKSIYSYTMEYELPSQDTYEWFSDAGWTEKATIIPKYSTGDREFWALLKPVTKQFTFNANGGTGDEFTETYDNTSSANAPAPNNTFTRDGYMFKGWGVDKSEVTYSPGENIWSCTRDKLYAIWEKIVPEYTLKITFVGPEGLPQSELPTEIDEEKKVGERIYRDLRAVNYNDKKYDPEIDSLEFYMPGRDVSITITYYDRSASNNIVNISYVMNVDGYSNYPTNFIKFVINSDKYILQDPECKGYKFDGWYSDSGLTSKMTEIDRSVAGNITVYAKWTALEQTITINYDGPVDGTFANPGKVTEKVKTGENYSFESPEIKGYVPDIKLVSGTMPGEDLSITVTYRIVDWNIRYYPDKGDNDLHNSPDYNITESIEFLDPARDGYEFGGWYTDPELTEKITGIDAGNTGNIRLYAKWQSDLGPSLTIKFIGPDNGHFTPLTDKIIYPGKNQHYRYTVPHIDGYTPNNPFVEGDIGTGDIVVEVTYTANVHRVTVDANYDGATAPSGWTSVGDGKFYKDFAFMDDLELPSFDRTGYTIGWSPSPPGKMGDSDLSFTAEWTADVYKITFHIPNYDPESVTDPKDRTYTVDTREYKHGERIVPPALPVRDGFAIVWNPEVPEYAMNNGKYTGEWVSVETHKLIVSFESDDEDFVNPGEKTTTWIVGENYTFDPSTVISEGYTFDPEIVTGIMGTEDARVTVRCTPITFTVKFECRPDSIPSQTVKFGQTATDPRHPDAEGRIFLGWYLGEEKYDFSAPVTSDITLIASFDMLTFKATFEGADGVVIEPLNGVDPSTIPYGKDFSFRLSLRTGYVAEGIVVKIGDTVLDPVDGVYTVKDIESDIVLTVSGPSPVYRLVMFMVDGAIFGAENVLDGTTLTAPAEPSKTGYTFVGWELDGAMFDFGTPVSSNITLTAVWKQLTFRVTLSSGIGYAIVYNSGFDLDNVAYGSDFRFRIALGAQYNQSTPVVKVDGVRIGAPNGFYTISGITSDVVVTVSNVVPNPVTPSDEPDVKVDPDGTKTTTEKHKDGSVTETVEKPDGSVTTKKTEVDGSFTEVAVKSDGSKTEKSLTKTSKGTIETETTFDSTGKETGYTEKKNETYVDHGTTVTAETVKKTGSDGKTAVSKKLESSDGMFTISFDAEIGTGSGISLRSDVDVRLPSGSSADGSVSKILDILRTEVDTEFGSGDVETSHTLNIGADEDSISLSSESFAKIAGMGMKTRLDFAGGSMELDSEVSGKISEGKGSLTLGLSAASSDSMNDKQKAAVGNRPAVDLRIASDSGFIHELGGKARITLAHVLPESVDPSDVRVFYIDDDGEKHMMETVYDAVSKMVSFVTPHFSLYMIGTVADAYTSGSGSAEPSTDIEQASEKSDDAGISPALCIGIAVAIVAILGAVFAVRRH